MARIPRPDIRGIPQYIVQRGDNRLPCFLDDEDGRQYLHRLKGGLRRHGCAMSNHIDLFVTPAEAGAVSMQKHGSAWTTTQESAKESVSFD
jgi:putative transposase